MKLWCYLVSVVISVKINKYPTFGTPSVSYIDSAAVYDSLLNTIIMIGGERTADGIKTSEVQFFNLSTGQWSSPRLSSSIIPPGFARHRLFLRADRKILVLGYFSEVYVFNLEDYSWNTEILKGDLLYGVSWYGMAKFKVNNTDYAAIFGGNTQYKPTNSLFLVDIDNMVCKKLPNNGTVPSPRMGISLEYYNNSLYMYGYSPDDLIDGKETGSELYRYDLENEFWEIMETFGTPPGPRIAHYSCIYNDEMYIIYGMIPQFILPVLTLFKFNFANRLWVNIQQISRMTETKFSSASLQVDEKLYLIGGFATNSILMIDLSDPKLSFSFISPYYILPSKRLYHCSFIINQYFYIVGGTDTVDKETQKYLSDMWAFDLELLLWTNISSQGSIPSGRMSASCLKVTGNQIAVFGGKGAEGYLNDLFSYFEPTKAWTKYETVGDGPSPRSNACICNDGYKIYIIGGKNDDYGFNDVWIYDGVTNTYVLTDIKIGGVGQEIGDIYDSKCWIEYENEASVLNIVGGMDSRRFYNYNRFKVSMYYNGTINVESWHLGEDFTQKIIGSETAVVLWKEYLIRIGGSVFNWALLQNIFIYNTKTEESFLINTRDLLDMYGHSAIHYKNAVYIFGGGGSVGSFRSINTFSNLLIKVEFDSEEFNLGCSEGTYLDTCEPCPKGTYYSNNDCVKCPRGTYNKLLASSSQNQCILCPEGTFTDKLGSEYCLECEKQYICPLGSQSHSYSYELPKNSSVQPKELALNTSYIQNFVQVSWLSIVGAAGTLFVLSISFNSIWVKLKKLDFFSSSHDNPVGIPVMYRKTSIGGLFFVFFILISAVIFIASFLTYELDNVSELKALIPIILIEDKINSKIVEFHSIFYLYGGECLVDYSCNPLFKVSEYGFSFDSRIMKCEYLDENCKVSVKYSNFYLTQKTSYVYISLEDLNAYASAISFNLTSYSSIPDEFSSFSLSFGTGSKGSLFKGVAPSFINAQFIPSIFYSESSNWPSKDVGYHIYYDNDIQLGGMVNQNTFNFDIYLRLVVAITRSENAMQTLRVLNQTWFIFIGSILGSIFGLMGSVAGLMNIIENISDRYTKKISMKITLNKIISKNLELARQINPEDDLHKDSRIVPLTYEISETYCERESQYYSIYATKNNIQ